MGRERDWLQPCVILVAAQWAVAALIAYSIGFDRPPPLSSTFWVAFQIAAVMAPLMVIGAIHGRITSGSVREAFDRQASKIVAVLAGIGIGAFQMALLTWCKLMLPYYGGGFWADPFLANLDFALTGSEPWQLARAIRIDGLIDLLYVAWIPLMILGMLAAFVSPASPRRNQAIIAFFLLFAFGSFSQFLMPSAGPIFYDLAGWGDRFVAMFRDAPATTYLAREWLWKFHTEGTVKVFIGISAMPSMHVAGAAWLALICRALWPRLFWPAAAYFGAILYGSVYLGLHYVSDGIVGTAAAIAIWTALSWVRSSHLEQRKAWADLKPELQSARSKIR